jgi:sortase A
MKSLRRRHVMFAAFALAAWQFGAAGYIHAKAWVAQRLLERAWVDVQAGDAQAKPWPWADTTPIARLLVERLGVDQIVLAGDSGRTLAFGPAWNAGSAAPGTSGTSVISGHRDTHFAFLKALRPADEVVLDAGGRRDVYRVDRAQIVDTRTTRVDVGAAADRLLLVTCYPFDAISARGPLRYVVEATRVTTDVVIDRQAGVAYASRAARVSPRRL